MTYTKLARRSLIAMRGRWERDLARLETAFPVDWDGSTPETETIRNLATAIAQIDGVINNAILYPRLIQ